MSYGHPFASAQDLLGALGRREVSALELADEAIARIEALDPSINAVVVRDFERARDAARAADEAIARGERCLLLGLPMTVKESHHVAGCRTTWGLVAFRDWVSSADGEAVRRLKSAGAVILGKTNVPPNLSDWQTDNPIYGRTNNPWDLTRTPGGSSGGSAAALAAGMTSLELGSDLAGSLRVPASFCGIFAHKPSYGLVSTRGFGPPGADLDELEAHPMPMAVIGPMARSAADLALGLDVLTSHDAPHPEEPPVTRALLIDAHPEAVVDSEIRAALDRLAADLERTGVKVVRESALLAELLPATSACFRSIVGSIKGAAAPDPAALLERHTSLQRRWDALLASFDVVLAPASGAVAFPHDDEPSLSARRLLVDGVETPYVAQSVWSSIASIAGSPSTVMPIDATRSGLPIGAQILAARGRDRLTIAFAERLERQRGGFRPPPH